MNCILFSYYSVSPVPVPRRLPDSSVSRVAGMMDVCKRVVATEGILLVLSPAAQGVVPQLRMQKYGLSRQVRFD